MKEWLFLIGAIFLETFATSMHPRLQMSDAASERWHEPVVPRFLASWRRGPQTAEMISADASELLSAVIDANPKFHKLYQMYKLVA
ncbi:hypothetical protein SAMN04487902_10141 [Prevotella sp. ne3005]|uniref:hypothetical protein n=1 Tax=Prevotella sp. ne3005 TaxID=1761887 RepID=UPI0008B7B79B|nr:hypothetical protein [Prevotella sp. ne3005]SEM47081.1 hypothetical protein SAMN04487902_10141 [Prevotella sp. ne3005]